MEKMLEYAEMYPEVKRALPSGEKEIDKLPRQYIANIINTIVGEPFR